VVNDAEVACRVKNAAAPVSDAREGLRARIFVCKVRIDVKQDVVRIDSLYGVRRKDLLKKSFWCSHGFFFPWSESVYLEPWEKESKYFVLRKNGDFRGEGRKLRGVSF
jgi:hypothetical protein